MKLYLHLRPWPALRRARGLLISSGRNPFDTSLSSLYIRSRQANMLPHPPLQQSDAAQLCLCLIPLHPFRPIQNTQASMWAASFKSLYPKRPSETMQLRTIAWRALQIQH
jgi:hypothetical protein